MSVTRASLYEKKGPLLTEAGHLVIFNEINIIREELGLPQRTEQQMLNAINNKLATLMSHNWMINST